MPRICYIEKRFQKSTLVIIQQAIEIIDEYEAQGFSLTLRQLYYQFVARDLIRNNMKEYKKLGNVINDARLAGLIDWNSIEDRTRYLRALSNWSNPEDIISSAAGSYREDLWASQYTRIEVWIEKDALVGVIEGICEKYRVPFFACRGYTSQSEQWRAAMRFDNRPEKMLVLHLGDHDPSGVDMTRDMNSRLSLFAPEQDIEVRRLALNMDQVEKYSPPPNPAKMTDTRAKDYIRKFGNDSWELDALEPKVISNLIESHIKEAIDWDAWNEAQEKEDLNKSKLELVSDNWDGVTNYLEGL